MTLAQAYKNLTSKGFIKPLDPTPMPNLYLLLEISMSIATSIRNPATKPTIASTLNMKYKTS